MKRLTSEVLYHPLVAQSTFYLTDVLSRTDLGLSGALFVLAARWIARFFRERHSDPA